MELQDLIGGDIDLSSLSAYDVVRFRFATEAKMSGDTALAKLILNGEGDEYPPLRWALFMANDGEHGPLFVAEWEHLTSKS